MGSDRPPPPPPCPIFSHATAAYIASASISLSGAFPPTTKCTHLQAAIAMFNQQVTQEEALRTDAVLSTPMQAAFTIRQSFKACFQLSFTQCMHTELKLDCWQSQSQRLMHV